MITNRQEKILNSLIKEYLDTPAPVSSNVLKKKTKLDVSPATIRNDLQELTDLGYIIQPHTSAGRVPTEKGYRYFIQISFSQSASIAPNFIEKEVQAAREKIENELRLAQELTRSLEQLHSTLSASRIQEDNVFNILKILGTPEITYDKNIETMRQLLEKFENF